MVGDTSTPPIHPHPLNHQCHRDRVRLLVDRAKLIAAAATGSVHHIQSKPKEVQYLFALLNPGQEKLIQTRQTGTSTIYHGHCTQTAPGLSHSLIHIHPLQLNPPSLCPCLSLIATHRLLLSHPILHQARVTLLRCLPGPLEILSLGDCLVRRLRFLSFPDTCNCNCSCNCGLPSSLPCPESILDSPSLLHIDPDDS